jgi:hypothetical protein
VEGLSLNGAHQLQVCADNVNLLGGNIPRRKHKMLLVSIKESGANKY